ncbi:hypothetical protein [Chitinibacter tainanensis]|uniref:hypothetical protein n=1 Tax=Chitinibacter tainanensis TaxID=230667 RepID=UPI0003F89172|nr:hypothetical protein [Chitinibacter tainanensis]
MSDQATPAAPADWLVILRPDHERKVAAKSKLYRLRHNQPERLRQLEAIVGDAQFKYNRYKRVIDSPEPKLIERLRQACVAVIGHDRDLVHYLIAIAIERSDAAHQRGLAGPATTAAARPVPARLTGSPRARQAKVAQMKAAPAAAGEQPATAAKKTLTVRPRSNKEGAAAPAPAGKPTKPRSA